jgi:uncharacterized protein with GYD domain
MSTSSGGMKHGQVHLADQLDGKGHSRAKDSAKRTDGSRALARQMGGDLEQVFLTMGSYDVVSVLEMPDDETAAEYLLKVASDGASRTTTLKAFDEASYRKILGAL